MAVHAILGKGPVGSTLAERLVAAGHEVRVLSRSGGGPAGTTALTVDASDGDALARAAAAPTRSTTARTRPTTGGCRSGRRWPRRCWERPR